MSRAVISLGSNLGDRSAHLEFAVSELRVAGELVAVSPAYSTAPVGGPEQPDYLNAVVLLETDLHADELLEVCHLIEDQAGRVRAERWGPRTLDLDLIAYDDVVSDDPELTLPHPRAAERAFVLRPWLDVDPDATLAGVPVRDLLAALTPDASPDPSADDLGVDPQPIGRTP